MTHLIDYMNYYIDELARRETTYYRIIMDRKINFPDYYFMVGHDPLIEIAHYSWDKHPNKGWGTKTGPDRIIGGVELWKLWKNNKIKTFEEWLYKEK